VYCTVEQFDITRSRNDEQKFLADHLRVEYKNGIGCSKGMPTGVQASLIFFVRAAMDHLFCLLLIHLKKRKKSCV
jgi:hypothetical protein